MSSRFRSVDALRGATMALMVLVNNPGTEEAIYSPLNHSRWDGWTLTDTVFPTFLWIAGLSIAITHPRYLAKGQPRLQIFLQSTRRAAILFALGLLVYLYPGFEFSTMRLMGVLQRIAICYWIASGIYLITGSRGQILWMAGLLGSYWLLMFYAPVPGYGAGDLSMGGNFAHYIDSIWLGRHNYASTRTWDPEGIVSTLPSIATALFGILAGRILQWKKDLNERTVALFLAGSALLVAGMVLEHWMPINKKLWTSSFAVFMAGLDFCVLAVFVWFIDGQGLQRGVEPLVIMGRNAIAVYMASELLESTLSALHAHAWIYQHVFQPLASPVSASLLYGLAYVALMYLIAWKMYRRGWFLKA